MRLTNTTRQPLAIVTGVEDGQPVTKDVRPGETETFAASVVDSNHVQGHLIAGTLAPAEEGATTRRSRKSEASE
jgi:hypothetical protein